MALVRVYCGLASADPTARAASAESRLTVAVVDDAGRLLDVCEVSDDPAGYAQLGALLVERSSGPTGVAIAADSDDHLVTSLLTAAGRLLAVADDDAVDDYAERFADDESVEEMESPAAERRAVGLARALQAGALSAVALPVPRDLLSYKPVLAAHAALCNGRLSAAVALREVLRELYPAALRAYPDPAEPVSLAVLDALPEPSLLNGTAGGRGRESTSAADAVIGQLAAEGVADAETVSEKITALRVAIAETPRRGSTSKALVPAISETVRQAVAAVRACDLGCDALISTLSARLTAPPASTGRRSTLRRAGATSAPQATPAGAGLHAVRPPAEEPAPTRVGRRARPEPAAASAAPAIPHAVTTPPVAPSPVTRPPVAPPPVSRPAAARGGDTGRRHAEPATHPAPVATPASAPPVAPASAPPLAPAASAGPAVRPPVAPPPASRPPVAPAAISAPTPLPIRSSAPPARPATPTVYGGGGMSDTAQIAMPLSRPEPPRTPQPPRVEPPRAPEPVSNRPVSAPPPPPPGITPIAPAAVVPSQRGLAPADSGEPFRATLTTAAINSARAERQRPTPIPPRPSTRHDGPSPDQSGAPTQGGFGATDLSVPLPRHAPEPGSRAAWPLVNSSDSDRSRADAEPSRPRLDAEPPARPRVDAEPAARSRREAEPAARPGLPQRANGDRPYSGYSELDRPAQPAATDGRIKPPWQADDLPQEPPMLRLVEPPPLSDRALDDRPLSGTTALDAPSLRLVDTDTSDRGARTARSRRAVERSAVPVAEEGDGDLLIFAQTRSAWFVGHPDEENQLDWTSSADTGWQAASQAATPSVGAETNSGLPRRVPQANLVPGSALPPREERPLRIVRDAQSIAAHTTGYFRGWRRGQEIGGYAVGGRPGRESAGGWDFSRDSVGREDEYRSAGYRS
ncbi:transposase [Phytohabitans sp. ZYX-F-186]|uniref:Transposase n=1 Tax=Phytohabitans maris TaxID=3071409 RepID=A0ABU0ZSM3_9ACTN|nr:transposase [Phytohabitans sp. ZYX-F-186]MDQ7910034.1 transposase [Phytohabitans sp. ZYX-F-186]